jgi:hypothetical protein
LPPSLAAAALIVILAGLAACSDHLPATALFQGVEGRDPAAGEQLIRDRLGQRFAVGRPEAGLDAFLHAQGMKTRRQADTPTPGLPIYGEASVRGAGVPCPRVAMVIWRADAGGVIRSLSVLYKQATCV